MHNTVSHPIIGKSKGCIALETIIVKDIKHKQQLATFVRKVFDKYQGEKLAFKKKKITIIIIIIIMIIIINNNSWYHFDRTFCITLRISYVLLQLLRGECKSGTKVICFFSIFMQINSLTHGRLYIKASFCIKTLGYLLSLSKAVRSPHDKTSWKDTE